MKLELNWLSLSIVVLIILAVQDIMHRYLMKEGFNAIEIVFYGFIPTIITAIIYIYYKSLQLRQPSITNAGIFLISGILSFISYLLIREAQIISPNIGYVNAIIYSSAIFTIVLTGYLFRDNLEWKGILGALFIIIGIALMTSINTSKFISS
jgi:drug/metabolite transporter (DMT)-like permease